MGEARVAKVSSNYFAKITRPSTDGSVIRQRLIDRLDKGRKKPITWVCGPGGCGKTTAISSYIEAKRYPSLWYQADKSDQDLATFFYNLGLAAERSLSSSHQPLPLLTAEYLDGIADFSRNFFALLFESLKEDTIIVIDNLHEIRNSTPIHNAIIESLSMIKNNIRFVMISREESPLIFVKSRANRSMEVLGWSDLRFTFEEFEEIAKRQKFNKLSNETLQDMYRMLDGWVAGLQLVLENARMRDLDTINEEAWSREEIFDYFGDQILNNLPADVQTFLLITSILPSMTASMARKLSGYSSAEKFLKSLHRNNQFTEKRIFENEVFQYHPIFREFLLKRAQTFFLEDHFIELKNKAAKLLMINGQKEDAVELFARANAWSDIERIIIQDGPKMISQGRYQVLQEWLDYLPEDKIATSPWLLYWSGVCRMPHDVPKSRTYLKKAYDCFKKLKEPDGLFLTWSDIVSTFVFGFINIESLDEWIDEIDDLLPSLTPLQSKEIEERFVISVFSALMFNKPYHPDIDMWTERMKHIVRESKDMNARVTAGGRLVLYYTYLGDLPKAGRIVNALTYHVRSGEALPFVVLDWMTNEIPYHWFACSHDRALEMIEESIELSHNSGIRAFDVTFYTLGVWISLGKEDHKTAKQYLDKTASAIPEHMINDEAHHYYLSALWLSQTGNTVVAAELAETALEFVLKTGFWLNRGCCSIALGHLYTELGKYEEAASHLERVKEIAGRLKKQNQLTHMYFLYSAYLFFKMDDTNECLNYLRNGMQLGKQRGFFETVWWQPVVMAKLCAIALENGIEEPYVKELIQRRKLLPDENATAIETWPWTIKIYTLGDFELVVNGQSIVDSDKFRHKPLSMLKALIALGGRNVKETEISDALWPDSDGDQAHRSFATTLHRLRKLLDLPETIVLRGKRLTLNEQCCWVDMWALERQLDNAEIEGKTLEDQQTFVSLDRKRKAIDLYKGPFLHDDRDEAWIIRPREHLRNRFLQAVEDVGNDLESRKLWEDAIYHYRKVLDAEPAEEMFYRRLMNCYKNVGRKSEALAVYERCSDVLKNLLDIIPSPETQSLQSELKEA